MNNPRHLFVVGCPRSGTTALGSFLAQHKDVVLGIERYGLRQFPGDFSLTPELFTADRFCDLRPGDTFYDALEFSTKAYGGTKEKFATAQWVGDKIPLLYQTLPKLFDRFDDRTRVVFIFRNVFDVVASYKARQVDPKDAWTKGTSAAITDWSASIRAYLTSDHQDRIIPIIYEDLFTDPRVGAALIDRLGLEHDADSRQALAHRFKRSDKLESGRKRDLSMDDVTEISMRASFGGFRTIVEKARATYFNAP